MTFGESVSTCLKKYFVIQGRASLSEFWWFQLIWVVCYLAAILSPIKEIQFISFGVIILILIPLLTVGIRRLHDTNRSGANYLWSLIPFVGSLIVLVMMLGDGTKGRNLYGDNPSKKTKKKK